MKLLFLDIDGVLNSHDFNQEALCGPIHADKMQLLNVVLRETGAKVVLSSAWRYIVHRNEATLQGMEWLLRSHGMLADRLVGITRQDTMFRSHYTGTEEWPMPNERGAQITDWLSDNGPRPERYAVVDDLELGIADAGHPLVLTDGDVGLIEANVRELLGLLR